MKRLAVLSLALLLSGCHKIPSYKAPSPPPTFSLMVPRQCIESVELSPDTYCRGKSLQELTCYRIQLHKKKDCEMLEVLHD